MRLPAQFHWHHKIYSHHYKQCTEAALLPFFSCLSCFSCVGAALVRALVELPCRVTWVEQRNDVQWFGPVGLPGIEGKQPAVIAASVAAQLLLVRGEADA